MLLGKGEPEGRKCNAPERLKGAKSMEQNPQIILLYLAYIWQTEFTPSFGLLVQ
jgi:hypothetical protein